MRYVSVCIGGFPLQCCHMPQHVYVERYHVVEYMRLCYMTIHVWRSLNHMHTHIYADCSALYLYYGTSSIIVMHCLNKKNGKKARERETGWEKRKSKVYDNLKLYTRTEPRNDNANEQGFLFVSSLSLKKRWGNRFRGKVIHLLPTMIVTVFNDGKSVKPNTKIMAPRTGYGKSYKSCLICAMPPQTQHSIVHIHPV